MAAINEGEEKKPLLSGPPPEGEKYALARAAYEARNVQATIAAHAVAAEKHGGGDFVKPIVFGGLDGVVTIFSIVAGVAGAGLSVAAVLVLGLAKLFADALSMGVGEFVGSKSEMFRAQNERRREEWEVTNYLEGEINEMVELYIKKGMPEEDARKVVGIMAKNKQILVDIMMVEELGVMPEDEHQKPLQQGFVIFVSFLIFGIIPLLAYIVSHVINALHLLPEQDLFYIAVGLSELTLMLLGAIKSKLISQSVVKGAVLMMVSGSLSGGASYGIGYLLQLLVKGC